MNYYVLDRQRQPVSVGRLRDGVAAIAAARHEETFPDRYVLAVEQVGPYRVSTRFFGIGATMPYMWETMAFDDRYTPDVYTGDEFILAQHRTMDVDIARSQHYRVKAELRARLQADQLRGC